MTAGLAKPHRMYYLHTILDMFPRHKSRMQNRYTYCRRVLITIFCIVHVSCIVLLKWSQRLGSFKVVERFQLGSRNRHFADYTQLPWRQLGLLTEKVGTIIISYYNPFLKEVYPVAVPATGVTFSSDSLRYQVAGYYAFALYSKQKSSGPCPQPRLGRS